MINQIALKGCIEGTLLSSDGKVKQKVYVNNLVVDTGLEMIASLLTGSTSKSSSQENPTIVDESPITSPKWLKIGSDGSDVLSADKDLRAPIENGQIKLQTITRKNNTVEFVGVFGSDRPSNNKRVTIKEVGLFSTDSDDLNPNVMLNRAVFNEVNKASDDVFIIKWIVTIMAVSGKFDSLES